MSYANRLKVWTIVRLSGHRWVIVGRFRSRSDAEGHLEFLRQQMPESQFKLVFELC